MRFFILFLIFLYSYSIHACDLNLTNPSGALDSDGDLIPDDIDLCPSFKDLNALMSTNLGTGDLCINFTQQDLDNDGEGDNCDSDIDGDAFDNSVDLFPLDPAEHADNDSDGIGNYGDNCPNTPNVNQDDLDNDTLGNECDPDIDGDGFNNDVDDFPYNTNENVDSDYDGIGDNQDNCPNVSNPDQLNADNDYLGDVCDDYFDPYDLAIGRGKACLIDEDGLSCWANGLWCTDEQNPDAIDSVCYRDTPSLSNPKEIAISSDSHCVIDGNSVICWGGMYPELPSDAVAIQFDDPKLLTISEGGGMGIKGCLIDQNTLKCWNGLSYNNELNEYDNFNFIQTPVVSNLTSLSLDSGNLCFIDSSLSCYHFDYDGSLISKSIPLLYNPKKVSLFQSVACAIDGNQLVCWKWDDIYTMAEEQSPEGYEILDVPQISNPISIDLGLEYACLLGIDEYKCWYMPNTMENMGMWDFDYGIKPPTLKRPYRIVLSKNQGSACAIDDSGLVCWNGSRQNADSYSAPINTPIYNFLFQDVDTDGDGIYDKIDNCAETVNPDQLDFDNDNQGNLCDEDVDGDGYSNIIEQLYGASPNDSSDAGAVELSILEASSGSTKNVPAMGGIGLLALGLSMLGLGAVRLRK